MISLALWDGISWKAAIAGKSIDGLKWQIKRIPPQGRNATPEQAMEYAGKLAIDLYKTNPRIGKL